MAAPKSRLAGYLVARKPPGTWVIKYPQKIEESTEANVSFLWN